MKAPFLFCILLLGALSGSSQTEGGDAGTLLLMSGNEVEIFDLRDTLVWDLSYRYDKNQFRKRKTRIAAGRKSKNFFDAPTTEKSESIPVVVRVGQTPKEEVFYFLSADGEKTHFFEPDTVLGYSLQEMESYVFGRRDAGYTTRGKVWFWAGVGVGLAGGYLLETSVFSLAVPPLFALGARIPVIHIKSAHISDARFMNDPDYASGFGDRARGINTLEALKGSAIGTALGILVFMVVDNN